VRSVLAKSALPAGLALSFAAQIGLLSSVTGQGVAPAVFPIAVGVVVMITAPVSGLRRMSSVAALGARDLALSVLAGLLGLFLPSLIIASNRFSDAPPGTELIFFAGVLWGAMPVLLGAARLLRGGRWRGSLTALCGALAAVTGAAGVLANWERPSSFSPLVRYATEEGWMLVAGACFLAGALLLARLALRHGSARPMLVSGAAGAASGVVAYLATDAARLAYALPDRMAVIALWAAAAGIAWLLLADALRLRRDIAAGASMMLAPSLVSLLIFVERLVGVSGPNPLVWVGIAGGTALAVAATSTLARADVVDDAPKHPATWLLWAGGALALAAAAGFILPTIAAEVTANRGGTALEAAWSLLGWETVSGWVALSCAALLVAAAVDGARWPAAAGLLAPAAYVALITTPYHVLTPGLASEVQVDFGTEYASIVFRALTVWPALLAVVGAATGLVLVLTGRVQRPVTEATARLSQTEE
jgi:hypothetical protein